MSAIEHLRQQIRKRIESSSNLGSDATKGIHPDSQTASPQPPNNSDTSLKPFQTHENNPLKRENEHEKKDVQNDRSRRASLSSEWKDIVESATQKLKTKQEELNRQLIAAQEEATMWQDKVDTIETVFTERSIDESDTILPSGGMDIQDLTEKLSIAKHKRKEWKQKYIMEFNRNQELELQLETMRSTVQKQDLLQKEITGYINEMKQRLSISQGATSTTELCKLLLNEMAQIADQLASYKSKTSSHSDTLETERLQSELADWKSRYQSLDSLFLSAQEQLKQDCEQWRQKYKECNSRLEAKLALNNKLTDEIHQLQQIQTQEKQNFRQQLEILMQNVNFLKHSLRALQEVYKRSLQSLMMEVETDLHQLSLKVKTNHSEADSAKPDIKILKEKVRILSEENKIMAVHIEILNKTIEAATRKNLDTKLDTKLTFSQPIKRPEHKTILRSRTLT